jgi:hypothetical protein
VLISCPTKELQNDVEYTEAVVKRSHLMAHHTLTDYRIRGMSIWDVKNGRTKDLRCKKNSRAPFNVASCDPVGETPKTQIKTK